MIKHVQLKTFDDKTEALKTNLLSLPAFQAGIGSEPLYTNIGEMMRANGIDMDSLTATTAIFEIMSQRYIDRMKHQEKRVQKAQKLFQKETSRIQLIMDGIEQM